MLKFRNTFIALLAFVSVSMAGSFGFGTNQNVNSVTYGTNIASAVYYGSNLVWSSVTDVLDGLVAHWTFDNVSGTNVTDDSGNGNAGTLVGGCEIVSGHSGNALSLTSTPGKMTIEQQNLSTVGEGDWSVTFWLKSRVAASVNLFGGVCVFDKYGVVNGSTTYFSTLLNDAAMGGWTVPDNSIWTHVSFTKSGATTACFFNGVLQTKNTFSDGGWGTTGIYAIGVGYNWPTYYFQGILDDVRIYGRALTSGETLQIYNATK